jgi:hypothetical protein
MNDDTPRYAIFEGPKPSGWKVELFGMGPMGIILSPTEDGVPNAFWRFMQRLILGNKWIKESKK